jgi:hypothetical protein
VIQLQTQSIGNRQLRASIDQVCSDSQSDRRFETDALESFGDARIVSAWCARRTNVVAIEVLRDR